jgi:RNA polymerase sigma-70 factor, ECF subfamily
MRAQKIWNSTITADVIELTGRMPDERTLSGPTSAARRDRDLLQRFRAGDREAFAEIYRSRRRAVYRFALLMTADEAKAAEITQDVFVWLIHHPERFDPDRGELGAFLVGIARQLLRKRYNEERRWVSLSESAACSQTASDRDAGDVVCLRKAIAALPERYRAVVVLCDLEGKTYEETAAIAGCAIGTVRSRLHRARMLLARKLVGKGCPA